MNFFRHITANNIKLEEYHFKQELAMEAYLIENPEVLKLDDTDFEEAEVLNAQIGLKGGGSSNNRDGRLDILAKYGMDCYAIIEIKKEEINEKALDQLEKYLVKKDELKKKEEIKTYFENEDGKENWIGILIGTSICPKLQIKLEAGYKTEGRFPIAGLVVKRYRSPKDEVFVITDTFFNYKYTKKDYSKFEFQNQEYKKGKLVHAVVKKYVENNPTKTFDELKEVFPDKLQKGNYGVFDTLENVNERRKKSKSDKARFHIKEDELIPIPNVKIATCNQWGIKNIQNFITHVNDTLGKEYTIEQKG